MHSYGKYFGAARWPLLACGLVVIAGCGGAGNSVHGKVTFSDGSPLTSGVVEMDGTAGSGTGSIQSDGTYEMTFGGKKGLPDGTYKVRVQASDMQTVGKSLVDKKYSSFETSGLTVTVAGDNQEFDITVEKPD